MQTRNVKGIVCVANIWIILSLQLTSWSGILFEKLIGPQEVKKFPHFMEPRGS
jgi:hypothetical protein